MSSLTNFGEEQLAKAFLPGTDNALVIPANWYIALSTTPPDEAGGNVTEPPAIEDYARVAVPSTDAQWTGDAGDPSGRYRIVNANAITFPQAKLAGDGGVGWGTVQAVLIYDTLSGGNAWAYTQLQASRQIDPGDTAEFQPGTLIFFLE